MDDRRYLIESGEILHHSHHILCLSEPAHLDGQAEAAVLVDYVQEFEPAAISGCCQLVIYARDRCSA